MHIKSRLLNKISRICKWVCKRSQRKIILCPRKTLQLKVSVGTIVVKNNLIVFGVNEACCEVNQDPSIPKIAPDIPEVTLRKKN